MFEGGEDENKVELTLQKQTSGSINVKPIQTDQMSDAECQDDIPTGKSAQNSVKAGALTGTLEDPGCVQVKTKSAAAEGVSKKFAEVKDSKWKAIFFMNLFALSATVQGAMFKYVAKEGVSVIEFSLFRNIWIGGFALIQMCYKKMNPFKDFPRSLVKDLIIRSMAGQTTFVLLNYSVTLLPMSTALILMQTNPFWISILACLLLKEQIRMIEILGIFACFGGVVMIAMSKA